MVIHFDLPLQQICWFGLQADHQVAIDIGTHQSQFSYWEISRHQASVLLLQHHRMVQTFQHAIIML